MSTSDQNGPQLTRKQLRELRLTGSTPVISEEQQEQSAPEAPDAREAPAVPEAPVQPEAPVEPEAPAEKPTSTEQDAASAPIANTSAGSRPLTRREMRALERARATASDASVAAEPASTDTAPEATASVGRATGPTASDPLSEAREAVKSIFDGAASEDPTRDPIIAGLPAFSTGTVPAAGAADTQTRPQATADDEERPKVGAAFGIGVKPRDDHKIPTAFDELLDTSSGSPKTASTLIFTPSPGVGSLSGPIASTGELLITGSYNLPDGIGSQGHAHGTTDGKDVDAVLIDGELAPSSSPTPIAASSAISTSKPAGEVIRPAAPDKGGKLTLTLAIIAGGLGLALVTVLIIAFTTNLF